MSDKKSKFITFFQVAKEMRKHQKDFFKTKSQASLVASKEAEKVCDQLIIEIEAEAKERGVEIG